MSPSGALVLCFSMFFEGRQNLSKSCLWCAFWKYSKTSRNIGSDHHWKKCPWPPPALCIYVFRWNSMIFSMQQKNQKIESPKRTRLEKAIWKNSRFSPWLSKPMFSNVFWIFLLHQWGARRGGGGGGVPFFASGALSLWFSKDFDNFPYATLQKCPPPPV